MCSEGCGLGIGWSLDDVASSKRVRPIAAALTVLGGCVVLLCRLTAVAAGRTRTSDILTLRLPGTVCDNPGRADASARNVTIGRVNHPIRRDGLTAVTAQL